MFTTVRRLQPFNTPESRRLAALFGLAYFLQAVVYLPLQTVTIVLKENLGLSASQVAIFFMITAVPLILKPVYGLISDFIPLFGYHRKSYAVIASSLTALAAVIGASADIGYLPLAIVLLATGLGIAFTDVVIDAVMVEKGRTLRLTGAFQSAQWTGMYIGAVVVGLLGGRLAEARSLRLSFLVAAVFPIVVAAAITVVVRDTRRGFSTPDLRRTWGVMALAAQSPGFWWIAAFIFMFNFSPSFGPSFFYYQTDTLKFSQTFIGVLTAIGSVGCAIGALLYAPLSRRMPLRQLLCVMISISALSQLGYLLYRDHTSAIMIDFSFGVIAIATQLAFFDVAARSCPPQIEGTCFAVLMSLYAAGQQGSGVVGSYLYEWLGFTPLVLVSALTTALVLVMLPQLPILEVRRETDA